MLTAKDKKQDLLTAMAAGADDYLAKPVDPSELRARVLWEREYWNYNNPSGSLPLTTF
jgi:DNA-binding response OmpR family regulator